ARVPRIEQMRVETELDVLTERLGDPARAVRRDAQIEAERRGWVVVLAREHADRVRVCRTSRRLPVSCDFACERCTRARTANHHHRKSSSEKRRRTHIPPF